MNTKFFLFLFCMGSLLGWTACDKDDDDHRYTPAEAIIKALAEKYPGAQRVSWEYKHGYEVADFYLGNQDTEAWFDAQGKWVLTETELPLSALPVAVAESLAAGPYASWKVKNEVDKIERPEAVTLYIIEVEQGAAEMDLYYTENGLLVKEIADNDPDDVYLPAVIPDAVKNRLSELYPKAVILEYEVEKQAVEVDILDGNIHKEVVFDSDYQWIYTEWEIRSNDVPPVVMQALRHSAYAAYTIDDVHIYEKPDGLFYEFELEQGKREVKITFDAQGVLI